MGSGTTVVCGVPPTADSSNPATVGKISTDPNSDRPVGGTSGEAE